MDSRKINFTAGTVRPTRFVALFLLSMALLSGCTSAPHDYAWSHSMSGDYLFAYDQGQCADQVQGATASPAFFSCMQGLGYVLVDS